MTRWTQQKTGLIIYALELHAEVCKVNKRNQLNSRKRKCIKVSISFSKPEKNNYNIHSN